MDKYPNYTVSVSTSAPGVMQRLEVDWNQLIARREFLLRDMPDDPDFNYLVLPEVERLLSSIEDGTTHLAVYTLWVTGARVSEMLMLRPEDFYLEKAREPFVSLPTLKNRTPKKKRHSRRLIGLGDGTFIETLRRYIKTQKIKRRELLFGQLSRHAIRHRINSAGRPSGGI
ncbi:tyrosine-type recombinase/integrase [uncultured Microbulbifer sp.]|uniref:tyrosine-type recombinase/integrase n=1 Tax=uncultured Microbulbifer sp. TaxID=348147 RepID=UPI0026380DE7|nr:tyrosine-type recombinase/integrase [uncultured Microbulbifer sp.]